MAGVKDNPAKLLLEGTLAPKPSRPPLNRSLVTGSDAPKGSKKLMRVEDQVLFESSEPGVKAETGLPPDVENQADVTPPVRTGL